MKKLLTVALSLALCLPVFAQRGPKLEQTITVGETKMSLNYTSLSYGEGKTIGMLLDKEGGKEMRAMMNERSANRPLATFKTSIDVKCGDAVLAAGEYQVYFTVDEEMTWSINFKMGEKVTSTKLQISDSQHESKRLLLCLYAEEEGAGVYLSFGKMSGMLSIQPHSAK
ncbi:MAG: DUF2911 domain-containing protein [Planctomycetes bacterium]|nr:DUF2911 domain-containing protein [Planctomycetota bacterium]